MNWFIAHLVGDYLIQTDWMALNKKTSSLHCLVHVITYMLPFLFCSLLWWQLLLIAAQHYAIDRTKFVGWFMGIKGSAKFRDGALSPWSWVVVDNVLHLFWIFLVVESVKFI